MKAFLWGVEGMCSDKGKDKTDNVGGAGQFCSLSSWLKGGDSGQQWDRGRSELSMWMYLPASLTGFACYRKRSEDRRTCGYYSAKPDVFGITRRESSKKGRIFYFILEGRIYILALVSSGLITSQTGCVQKRKGSFAMTDYFLCSIEKLKPLAGLHHGIPSFLKMSNTLPCEVSYCFIFS